MSWRNENKCVTLFSSQLYLISLLIHISHMTRIMRGVSPDWPRCGLRGPGGERRGPGGRRGRDSDTGPTLQRERESTAVLQTRGLRMGGGIMGTGPRDCQPQQWLWWAANIDFPFPRPPCAVFASQLTPGVITVSMQGPPLWPCQWDRGYH